MRTTVELPDDLFRRAKARAALQGQSLKDLVADGLKLLLQSPEAAPASRTKFPIITAKDPARTLSAETVAIAGEELLTAEALAASPPPRKRASAGAWAKQFLGIAQLAPGETTDDARMAHYRKKYGV